MDKKKGVIIAVVLLLLLMVGTFAFQRDDETKLDGGQTDNTEITNDDQDSDDNNSDPETDVTTPETDDNVTDDDDVLPVNSGNGNTNNGNNGNGNGNTDIPKVVLSTDKLQVSVNSGNSVLTEINTVDTTLNELLDKLEKAVSEGEEIISNPTTQAAIDSKQEEIDNLLKQIQDYLEDAYKKAEEAVELSEKENTKENLENAKELVDLLPDGERKDALLDRIKDTTAPVIVLNGDSPMTLEVGIDTYEELGATVTDNVDETITNLQPVLINYSIGGVFVKPVDHVDTTKVGTYKIVYKYTDQAGNVAVDANRDDHDYVMRIVNVVDTIAPSYETLRLLRIEPDYSTFAKNGDKIRVLVDFKEELAVLPKLKINDEIEVNFRFSGYREDSNTYLYMADYTIPADESELAEGELSILVYGYADSSNNIGEELDNSKINHDTQNMIIYDRTLPTYNFTNGNTFPSKEVVVTDEYFDHMTIYNYATGETTTTQENTWMMNSGNTMYKLTAYDKAGNYKEIWIYHDDSVAAFEGTGKVGGEDTEFTDGGIYQSLSLRVSDNDLISVVQELNGEKTTLASYTWENNPESVDFTFTEEGTYTITATDRAGNTSYVTFTIDTTSADAMHHAVNILEVGEPNEQSEYFVTVGDTIQVYARFDEKLMGNPTFALISNGNEYVIEDSAVIMTGPNDDGEYTYKINYEVKADEMDEGEVTLKISNIYDLAGNKTKDITKPTNGHRVYIDRVNPEVEKVQIFNKDNSSSQYIKNGETVRILATFKEELLVNPTITLSNGESKVATKIPGGNGEVIYSADFSITSDESELTEGLVTFTISGYKDLAENEGATVDQTVASNSLIYDRTAPVVAFPNTHGEGQNYKSWETLTITITENNLSEVYYTWANTNKYVNATTLVPSENIKNNGNGTYTVKVPTIEGRHRLNIKAVDAAGHITEVYSTKGAYNIDTIAPVVAFPETHSSNADYKSWETLPITITDENLSEVYYTWANINKYVSATTLVPSENIIDNGDGTYTVNVPTVDGRNRLNIKAIDTAGNETEVYSTQGAYNIDTTAPIVDVVYSTKDLSQSVIVTLIANEDIKPVDAGLWNPDGVFTTELSKVYFNNVDQTITVVDKAGNKTEVPIIITNVDRDAPVVDFPETHNFNADYKSWETLTITITERELSEVYYTWANIDKYVSATTLVPSGNITKNEDGTYTVKVPTIDGRNRLNIKAIDAVGNVTEVYSTQGAYNIDTTAPEAIGLRMVGGNGVDVDGQHVWYVSNDGKIYVYAEFAEKLAVSPKLKINDQIVVEFNDGTFKDDRYIYSAIYTVKEDDGLQDGAITIEVYDYADKAGNVGKALKNEDITLASQKNVVIDKTNPIVLENNSTGKDGIYSLVNLKLFDANSIVKLVINGKEYPHTGKYIDVNDGYILTFPEGKNTIEFTDVAGNTTVYSFIVDKTASVVQFPATHNSNANYKSWETLEITITEDDLSEVYYTWAKTNKYVKATTLVPEQNIIDNGDGTYTVKVPTVDGRNRLNIKAVDKAGNVTEVYSTKGAYNIDTTAPTFNITDGMVTNDNVLVEVTDANYAYTVITNVTSTNQTKSRFTLEREGNYTLTAYDNAGNSTTVTLSIDRTAPVVRGVENGGHYTGSVTLIIDEPNIQAAKYQKDGGKWYSFESGHTFTEKGTYFVRVTDKAYNKKAELTFTIE